MKTFYYLIALLSLIIFSSSTVINKKSESVAMSSSSPSLVLIYQGGVGLIKDIEIGDSNDFYALRIKIHSAVERVRIDWHASDKVYTKTYFPTPSTNYVDIPSFLSDEFVIGVEATDVSADMSDIGTRYETRRYQVIR